VQEESILHKFVEKSDELALQVNELGVILDPRIYDDWFVLLKRVKEWMQTCEKSTSANGQIWSIQTFSLGLSMKLSN